MRLSIPKVSDFRVTGRGTAAPWHEAAWQPLRLVGKATAGYPTRGKVVYSDTGIYFLVDGEDRKLTCTMKKDFMDIYGEDVIEVFLWPNEKQDLYFEYEISPLNVELPILIPNHNGRFMGWRPWHYEEGRLTRTATSVRGGRKKSMAKVEGWTAEFFIPFALLVGLGNTPPKAGTEWRANMYRIDYDSGEPVHWAWCPKTGCHFHDFKHFGTFVFG